MTSYMRKGREHINSQILTERKRPTSTSSSSHSESTSLISLTCCTRARTNKSNVKRQRTRGRGNGRKRGATHVDVEADVAHDLRRGAADVGAGAHGHGRAREGEQRLRVFLCAREPRGVFVAPTFITALALVRRQVIDRGLALKVVRPPRLSVRLGIELEKRRERLLRAPETDQSVSTAHKPKVSEPGGGGGGRTEKGTVSNVSGSRSGVARSYGDVYVYGYGYVWRFVLGPQDALGCGDSGGESSAWAGGASECRCAWAWAGGRGS